jgi:hypothetical protein
MKRYLHPLVLVLVAAIAAVAATAALTTAQSASAHRSGCHRWHSCPSDTGSYVCGDLGYDTYCPKSSTSSTSSGVRKVSVTSPIGAGAYATLVVKVARSATCSITVNYKSGPSHAAGLYSKHTNAQRRVSWTWKVGTRTTAGRWPIVVRCGSVGTLRTSFVVT